MTENIKMTPVQPQKIGLIAGNGHFPVLFAKAAKKNGVEVVAVAMHGETLPDLAEHVTAIHWVKVGQLGKTIRHFVRAGITQAAMAGGVRKTRLYERARPDLLGLKLLAQLSVRRDDGMLRAVANEFLKRGIEIIDSTVFMPDALAPLGTLTAREPTAEEAHDLAYGLKIARIIGGLDIGQTVIVCDGAVVALEAIEGTDACITRAGQLLNNLTRKNKTRRGVMVKVAKPDQDMRFDVPAIGPKTIQSLAAASIHVLGIEAGRTLLLEPEKILKTANAMSISIVGLSSHSSKLSKT